MAAETLSCPYCNASLTLDRPAAAGQRLRCPRCHELFPHRGGERGTQNTDYAGDFDLAGADGAFGERADSALVRPWSNRSVGLIILSIMVAMAGIGLAFAWYTTDARRQRDHLGETSTPTLAASLAVEPAKLAALGYLPDAVDAIAGIHLGELMARRQTRELLLRLFDDDRLQELTGLRLPDLDHVVLGVKWEENSLPHLWLIAQTSVRYDGQKIFAALHANRPMEMAGKTAFHIRLQQSPLDGGLWFVDEHTLVLSFGSKLQDFAELPRQPIQGVQRFAPQIRDCLRERMRPGTQAWVVGTAPHREGVMEIMPILMGVMPADQQALTLVRAFSGQLAGGNGKLDGRVEFQCDQAESAAKLDRYLVHRGLERQQLEKSAEQWPQAAPLLHDLAQSLQREPQKDTVTVQFGASLGNILKALEQPAP
jgi:hypothetical protein